MSDETSPQLLRQELGVRLRELRQSRDMTVEDVAGRLLCSASKISRMETGKRGASQRDVRDLCDIYQVEDAATREELMGMARDARKRNSEWPSGDAVGDAEYAGLEGTASEITVCVTSLLPVLLQTGDYAEAQLRGRESSMSRVQIDQRIQGYDLRQRVLTRKDAPAFTALIDEAALHRRVGGAEVMHAQLDRLLRAGGLPNVELLVLPFAVGGHPAAESSFVFLEFEASPVDAIVYYEGLFGQRSLKNDADIQRCRNAISTLRRIALDAAESARSIRRIRDTNAT